jgi:hypothetical protein
VTSGKKEFCCEPESRMDHLLSGGYVEQPATSSTDLRAQFLAFTPGGEVGGGVRAAGI